MFGLASSRSGPRKLQGTVCNGSGNTYCMSCVLEERVDVSEATSTTQMRKHGALYPGMY